MTKEEVLSTLPVVTILFEENIKLGDSTFISVDDFMERFNGAELSYSDLHDHENATPMWKDIFDEWKEEGILN